MQGRGGTVELRAGVAGQNIVQHNVQGRHHQLAVVVGVDSDNRDLLDKKMHR